MNSRAQIGTYIISMSAASPEVLSCFAIGLYVNEVYIYITTGTRNITYFFRMAVTSFPVSRRDDVLLCANTSGATSRNTWFVANRRRQRAASEKKMRRETKAL